jgi:glycosyltransferase involved in cell wall biosynthesis
MKPEFFHQFDKHVYHKAEVPNPKVSICLITYNHAPFIEQCLQSIIDQETSFEFEIILGDDCSKDGNQEKIIAFIAKYPKRITAYLHPYNLGPKDVLSKNNLMHAFYQCKGDYIIHIEGDDYFTDKHKLQKQVDFLEQNSSYSACFHNALIVYEDGSQRATQTVNPDNQKDTIYTDDLIDEKERWFMATASVMMRRKFVHPLPHWFYDSISGDFILYAILTHHGPIGYLKDIMTVYRKNSNGMSYHYHFTNFKFIRNRILMYKGMKSYNLPKYNKQYDSILADYYFMLSASRKYQTKTLARLYYTLIGLKYSHNWTYQNIKSKIWENVFLWQPLKLSTFIELLLGKTPK